MINPFRTMDQSIGVLKLLSSSVEVVQTCSFPALVGALWYGLRRSWLRVPNAAVIAALLFWAFSASYIDGQYPAWAYGGKIILTELKDGDTPVNLRESYRMYGRHAEQRNLPEMSFIHHAFRSEADARAWLHSSKRPRVLLRGKADWPRAVLSPDARDYYSGETPVVNSDVRAQAAKLGIDIDRDAALITLPDLGLTLATQITPEEFRSPSEPQFLSHEFLGQLASGIGIPLRLPTKGESSVNDAVQNAKRRDILLVTATLEGHWKSFAPLAAGSFFVGTHDLLTAGLERSTLLCSYDAFLRGTKRADNKQDAELFAAISNNKGVARIALAYRDKDFIKAERAFRRAAVITDGDGQPVLGAKLALLNLHLLEQSGLI